MFDFCRLRSDNIRLSTRTRHGYLITGETALLVYPCLRSVSVVIQGAVVALQFFFFTMPITSKTKDVSPPLLSNIYTRLKKQQLAANPSNSDLLAAIYNLRSSQTNILSSNNTLVESFSDQFFHLKDNIRRLATQA